MDNKKHTGLLYESLNRWTIRNIQAYYMRVYGQRGQERSGKGERLM